jgi:hypothetical protein
MMRLAKNVSYRILMGRSEGKRLLEDLDANERVILKCNVKETGYKNVERIYPSQDRHDVFCEHSKGFPGSVICEAFPC